MNEKQIFINLNQANLQFSENKFLIQLIDTQTKVKIFNEI